MRIPYGSDKNWRRAPSTSAGRIARRSWPLRKLGRGRPRAALPCVSAGEARRAGPACGADALHRAVLAGLAGLVTDLAVSVFLAVRALVPAGLGSLVSLAAIAAVLVLLALRVPLVLVVL